MIISKKSWHYKLLGFLGWHKDYGRTSLCPYFWKLIAALSLTLGLAPTIVTGMGLDAYSVFSPAIQELYRENEKHVAAVVAEAEEAEQSKEVIKKIKEKESLGPIGAVKAHWGVENMFLRVMITLSMILGMLAWLCVAAAVCVGTFFLLKIGCEKLNEKTQVGNAIGRGASVVLGKPARATGSVFSAWWRAHKEKHCPLIEFVEE